MRKQSLRTTGLLVLGSMVGITTAHASEATETTSPRAEIEHGKYIARAADCAACHMGPDGTPYAGGRPISTPMGDVVATNITSSKEYGIGDYSLEDLTNVLRHGKTPDGSHLYPAMPYPSYRGMKQDDIAALYAYLQSIPAVDREPEAHTDMDFPFNFRILMAMWNTLELEDDPASQGQDGAVSRGQYLVDHLAHCGTCHTPRDDFMASDSTRYLSGARLGIWSAPNITSDETSGIGAWQDQQLADYFKHGMAGYVAQAAGPMGEAVHQSLQYLSEKDRLAIAAYLKTVPAIEDDAQQQPVFDQMANQALLGHEPVVSPATRHREDTLATQGLRPDDIAQPDTGQGLYLTHCAACHAADGNGQPVSYYPSLNGNTTLRRADPRNLIAVITEGVAYQGATPLPQMPGFAEVLSHAETAKVANHVRTEFGGHDESQLTAQDVNELITGERPVPALIRHAGTLAWLGIIVAVTLAGLAGWWLWRRRDRRQPASATSNTHHSP